MPRWIATSGISTSGAPSRQRHGVGVLATSLYPLNESTSFQVKILMLVTQQPAQPPHSKHVLVAQPLHLAVEGLQLQLAAENAVEDEVAAAVAAVKDVRQDLPGAVRLGTYTPAFAAGFRNGR
jgi:hypothetical protein